MRARLDNFLSSLENEYLDYFHTNRSQGIHELRHNFTKINLSFLGV